MKLKVCGITSLQQLEALQEMNVDYAGMIFYNGSKRYAHEKLKEDAEAIRNLTIKKVGVFVNERMDRVQNLIDEYRLDAVQLHGDEEPEFCAALSKTVDVIKVVRMNANIKSIDSLLEPFQESAFFFLFDTDSASYGGSGHRFDWSVLSNAIIGKPFFLSGGIGPESMGFLKSFQHPFLYAVDVNSQFETAPGYKDLEKVKQFAAALQQPLYG